jgi:hypothetical protein
MAINIVVVPEATLTTDLAQALRHETGREMGRRNLLDYCRLVDPKYDTEAKHIVFLANVLERVERGELEKVIVTVMRRSGKSKLLSRFSSWWLGRNEGQSLLLLSASQNLSIRNSRWIRNDVTSRAYPWDVSIDETSSSILSWRTSTENEVRAFSVGSVLTGQGGHLILADDIQADQGSAVTRDALETGLRSILESRREPNAPLIILNNRWSTDDIVARLIDGPDGGSFEVINLEAVCESADDPLGREIGEPTLGGSGQSRPLPNRVILSGFFAAWIPASPVHSRPFPTAPLENVRKPCTRERQRCFLNLHSKDSAQGTGGQCCSKGGLR